MSCNKQINRDSLDHRKKVPKAEHGDEFDLRKFASGLPRDAPLSDIFTSDPDCCVLVHFNRRFDEKGLFGFALHADGACLGNGTPAARASVGVYGTPGAWYNEGSLLPPNLPQTNQSAEIYSAIAAIKVARDILKQARPDLGNCGCPSVVVLLMDSSYLVNAMTDWIREWRANGFRNARGLPVANAEAFKRLDHDIRQAYADRYLRVRFCHVPREYNSGADGMAAKAFHGNRFLDLSPADSSSNYDFHDSEVTNAFCGLRVA